MIRTEHLRKIYRIGKEKVVALADVNLEIAKGEVCCIVGPSGSGKSTLLNMLAGLEKPSKGLIVIAGKKVSLMDENQLATFRQECLGFIFQSYNLLPQLTAAENVALPLMFTGMSRGKRLKRAKQELKEMGLAKRIRHKPTEMSGGQQQRVGIARAFVAQPQVIFADEPTGNLDSHTTRQVLKTMLERAAKHNITFVMVTHERDLAACGDRIITLQDGHVVSNVLLDDATKMANRAILFADTGDFPEDATSLPPEDLPLVAQDTLTSPEDATTEYTTAQTPTDYQTIPYPASPVIPVAMPIPPAAPIPPVSGTLSGTPPDIPNPSENTNDRPCTTAPAPPTTHNTEELER